MRWILVLILAAVMGCANPYQMPCFLERDCARTPINP